MVIKVGVEKGLGLATTADGVGIALEMNEPDTQAVMNRAATVKPKLRGNEFGNMLMRTLGSTDC